MDEEATGQRDAAGQRDASDTRWREWRKKWRDANGNTLLHLAAMKRDQPGNLEEVAAELASIVDAQNKWGRTALHYAAKGRWSMSLAEELLKRGADPNVADDKGFTPIFEAVTSNNLRMVKVLAEAGADVDARAHDGNRPIISCWPRGDLMKYLIERGADPNARMNTHDPTLLMRACSILMVMSLSAQDRQDAADNVRYLIEHGADIHAQRHGESVVFYAVRHSMPEIVKVLIEAGAATRDASGQTLRTVAVNSTPMRTYRLNANEIYAETRAEMISFLDGMLGAKKA